MDSKNGSKVPAPTGSPPPRRMTLAAIRRGMIDAPDRILLYAAEKTGKTTFAANAPAPVFLASEDGMGALDVARFPEPQTWGEVLDALDELTTGKHEFQTIVLDTVDWLEPLAWQSVIEDARAQGGKARTIEEVGGGYGKGYVAALDKWRGLLARLDRLRTQRSMRVILLAHAAVRTWQNPEGPDYDRFQLKLAGKGASNLLKEWVDHLLFARVQVFTVGGDAQRKGKAVSTNARVIHTTGSAAFEAGTRASLPAEIPLEWDDFAAALAAGKPGDPAVLLAQCEAMLPRVADEVTRAKVAETITRATGRASYLAKILDRLTALTGIAHASTESTQNGTVAP